MINSRLKNALKDHYASNVPAIDAGAKELTIRLVEESATKWQCCRAVSHIPFWRFTLEQLMFIHPSVWMLQLVFLIGMFALIIGGGEYSLTREGRVTVIMSTAVLSVALGIPNALKSFEYRISELESSCMHNCVQVLAARLALFGLADVLWITLAVAIIPSLTGIEALRVFLYAATPFFCFCAVGFYVARITRGGSQTACIISAGLSILALWGLNAIFPHWYASLSVATWIMAFVCSVALATHEVRSLMSQIAEGLSLQTPNTVL